MEMKKTRRRYRTRMFDNRLSLPTTSEQVRQLQAESDAEGRSVASLVREAIDQFLPRLRDRRRKHRQPPDGQSAVTTKTKSDNIVQGTARRLLGEPQRRTAEDWYYGPEGSLKINLEFGNWYDSKTKEGGGIMHLVMRELKLDQAGAFDWLSTTKKDLLSLTDDLRPSPGPGSGFAGKAQRLLGEPQERTAQEWRYGPEGSLRINLETGLWKDSETKKGGNFLELIQRELQTDTAGAVDWLTSENERDRP